MRIATRPSSAAIATRSAMPGSTATVPRWVPKGSPSAATVTTPSADVPLSMRISRAGSPTVAPAGNVISTWYQPEGTICLLAVTSLARTGSPLLTGNLAMLPTLTVSSSPVEVGRCSVLEESMTSPGMMSTVAKGWSTKPDGLSSIHMAVMAMRPAASHRAQGVGCSQITSRKYVLSLSSGRVSTPQSALPLSLGALGEPSVDEVFEDSVFDLPEVSEEVLAPVLAGDDRESVA